MELKMLIIGAEKFLLLEQRLSRAIDAAGAVPAKIALLVGGMVAERARQMLGTYQTGMGMYPAWPALSAITKADRLRRGYSANEPLLRTGAMRESIHSSQPFYTFEGVTFIVGYMAQYPGSRYAVYHETGTIDMPARPVLGPAAFSVSNELAPYIRGICWEHFNIIGSGEVALTRGKAYGVFSTAEIMKMGPMTMTDKGRFGFANLGMMFGA